MNGTTFAGHVHTALEADVKATELTVVPPAGKAAAGKVQGGFSPKTWERLQALISPPDGGKGLSEKAIAAEVGMSTATFSQMKAGKYTGDALKYEDAVLVWLETRARRLELGHAAVETEVTRQVGNVLGFARAAKGISAAVGRAGIGLTTAVAQTAGPQDVSLELRSVDGGRTGVLFRLRRALTARRLPRGVRRYDDIVAQLKGSRRLIVVDGAHNLTVSGLRALADVARETECPVCLVGGTEAVEILREDEHVATLAGLVQVVAFSDRGLADAAKSLAREIVPAAAARLESRVVAAAQSAGNLACLPVLLSVWNGLMRRDAGDAEEVFDTAARSIGIVPVAKKAAKKAA